MFVDRHVAEGRADKVAIICGDRRVTYGSLAELVNRVGHALRRVGVQQEQRVLLVLPDGPEFAAAYFGAMKIGAVAVPTSTGLRSADYAYALAESRARVLIVHASLLPEVAPGLHDQAHLQQVVVCGTPADDGVSWDDWLNGCSSELEAAPTTREDVAFWLWTSGSTGRPKAAVHLHGDWAICCEQYGHGVLGISQDDVTFSASKLFHAYGLGNGLMFPFHAGATTILAPERPQAKFVLETVQDKKPTVLFSVPTLYAAMLQEGARTRYELGSVRLAVSAAEPLPAAVFCRWRDLFGIEILDGIGSTEVLHIYLSARAGNVRPGSTGQAVPGYELRIVDTLGHDVPPGTIGDLLVAGDSTAPYYWSRRALTVDRMRGRWFFTGDKYAVDADGFYWYAGRSDDMFRVSGQWVSPIEVENALIQHASVFEAAVVAYEEDTKLHTPKAFVVLQQGCVPAPELVGELQQFVKQRIAPHQYPRRIEFLAELPKNAAGKVLRYKLREADARLSVSAVASGEPSGSSDAAPATPVRYQVEEHVAVITIQNPPVNALSVEVQTGLHHGLKAALEDPDVCAVVLIGAGQTFIAGSDIKHLERAAREGVTRSMLPTLLMDIEGGAKPVVAALHGHALGGGLETALAAHYRIASPDCRIGQPEVKLGLIPGAGGTQRLPRLAGIDVALEMCAFGNPITAEQAHRVGIVDRIAEGDLLTAALAMAREAAQADAIPRTRERPCRMGTAEELSAVFASARVKVGTSNPHLIAPLAAIDAVEAAATQPFIEGCRREREAFERLLVSEQAKALLHLFLAERAVEKTPKSRKEPQLAPVQSAAVIGAGTMGRGIAMAFANAGIPVRLKETRSETLDNAMAAIRRLYENSAAKGRLTSKDVRARLDAITPQLDDQGLDQADLIVEAAFEDIGVKREVFAAIDRVAKRKAILATNTSYLDVDEIAAATSRPERVVGLHFFSPANVMRLLEIVPGRATSKDVVAACRALAKRLGKFGVVAGNCPGFIGNRMLRAYRREAQLLLEEGATPWQVDQALERWGMAMGPFAAQDLAGIDIAMKSRHVFASIDAPGVRVPRVIDRLYALGRFGQKAGAGWYLYDEGRKARPDPAVEALIEAASEGTARRRRAIAPEEIVERAIYALINEGADILEEGHASRASDIDVVYVHGYGFPAFRGGPLQHGDAVGLPSVCERLHELRHVDGEAWDIAPLLQRLAQHGSTFAEWDAERDAEPSKNR